MLRNFYYTIELIYQGSLIEYYNNKLSLGLNNSNSDDTLLTKINITSALKSAGRVSEWTSHTHGCLVRRVSI